MARKEKGLSPKQEAFCLAYATSGNATKAYKEAGYKVKSDAAARAHASRLVTKGNVQKRLQEIQDEMASEKIMDAKEMQERLTEIARQTAKESYVLADGSMVERKAGFKDALKAMELLGKMQGAFLDRQQVELSGAIPVVIRDDV